MPRPSRRTRATIAGAVVGLGALALRRSFVDVRGPSMEPTLWAGDRLLTVPAWSRRLAAGQVVVLRDPADADHLVIKRVSRVVGDQIEVHGDDPTRSTDTRTWGAVPRDAVRRIAVTRWPAVLSPLTHRSG